MSTRALLLAVGLGLAPQAAPAAGALAEVFPGGLPAPFEAVLDRLRAVAGPENVATALVPLGRSLQRFGADPDYFGSPRIVVAVTGDRAGPGEPRLADRLFLGYQPAAEIVEAMSYDEAAGRFEFVEVVGYPGQTVPNLAEDRVCLACHQGAGPIFPRPLWAESNANPAVAARLAGLAPSFHGAPVAQTVDALAAFDAATDRGARIEAANRLWAEGCPDAACRAALLAAAVGLALGARDVAALPAEAVRFEAAAGARWPAGLSIVSPDLANRDPLAAAPGADSTGPAAPETPRPPVVVWRPADGFAGGARLVAAELGPADVAWLDGLVRLRGGPGQAVALDCKAAIVGGDRRFDCAGGAGSIRGFTDERGEGRIEALTLAGLPPLGGFAALDPRLPDGRRLEGFAIEEASARFRLVDDLAPLAEGLAAEAEHAEALGPGPFRRRAVLALIGRVLGAGDG
jgi:hypothetical protein